MRKLVLVMILSAIVMAAIGCSSPKGKTVADKRDYINEMKDKTLQEFYEKKPEGRQMIQEAAGYAVFSNIDYAVIFVSGGNGYGVAVDEDTGQKTYMKMYTGGVGLGIGAKDFKEVIIFKEQYALDKFIAEGWEFGGQAGAAVKSGDQGGAASAAGNIAKNVKVYQWTETGFVAQANLTGTKYVVAQELN